MTATVHETVAQVHFIELTDAEGRLFLVPAATVNALRLAGLSSVTVTIGLTSEPPQRWLTVTEAARQHLDDVDGLTLTVAKAKVSRACREGKIASTGEGTARRIDPTSLAAWRLAERERNLERADEAEGGEATA